MATSSSDHRIETLLEKTIFASRWLQAPLYVGLIIAQGVYVYQFFVELWHLVQLPFLPHEAHTAAKVAAEAAVVGAGAAEAAVVGAGAALVRPEVAAAVSTDLSTAIMLMVLGLIDVVMIANLLIMVIIGGYETFVSRLHLDDHADLPEWLSHVNAGMLKVKLATALISISSIHLLKTFIEVRAPGAVFSNDAVMWQIIIHGIFVLSAIALAITDRVMMTGATPETAKH